MSEYVLGNNRWKMKCTHSEPAGKVIEKVRRIVEMRDSGMTYPQISAIIQAPEPSIWYLYTRWNSWAHNRQPQKTKIQP